MKLSPEAGATRGSVMAGLSGAYLPVRPPASKALQTGRLRRFARAAAREASDIARTTLNRRRWLARRPASVRDYVEGHPVRKVHLGAGPVLLEGWLNADFRPRTPRHVFIDVTERLPFEDSTVDYIFTEHLIGDLTYPQAGMMLGECHRVLKRGGKLRIATTSLAKLAELYRPERSPAHDEYIQWTIDEFAAWADAPLPGLVINNLFQEHPFVYDPDTLRHVLTRAGFADIVEQPFGRSTDPVFDGIDSHGRVLGRPEISGFESVTMEAVRG